MRRYHHPAVRRLGLALPLVAGIALLLLVLGSGAILQVTDQRAGGPLYTVAALRAHLAHDPAAWLDRPLRVQAVASVCTTWDEAAHGRPCLTWGPALTDPGVTDGAGALPVVAAPAPPLVSFLRRLPLIGSVLPAPQQPRWDSLGTYHIQLHAVACDQTAQQSCYYYARLLDAAPDSVAGVMARLQSIQVAQGGPGLPQGRQ
jgi:hypothetical protein